MPGADHDRRDVDAAHHRHRAASAVISRRAGHVGQSKLASEQPAQKCGRCDAFLAFTSFGVSQ
jgi:hypothetical protein